MEEEVKDLLEGARHQATYFLEGAWTFEVGGLFAKTKHKWARHHMKTVLRYINRRLKKYEGLT